MELSQKLVRIIIRRPHAYQFAADHKGVSIPGVCFFDAGGTLAGNAALKDAESLLELMRKQAK